MARPKRRRRTWLGNWLRDEDFWRGIVIQTGGTLLAGAIVSIAALSVGRGEFSNRSQFYLLFTLTFIPILIVGVAFSGIYIFALRSIIKSGQTLGGMETMLFIAGIVGPPIGLYFAWHALARAFHNYTNYYP